MTPSIAMLRADARTADGAARQAFVASIGRSLPSGSLLLATCHRVELSASPAVIDALGGTSHPAGFQRLEGEAAARHLVRVAVGLESVVLGEDQVLHQLRSAVAEARSRGALPPTLDRLADLALRAGRRARSWLPADRPSLADVALDRVGAPSAGAAPILVVGAGAMGSLAARAVRSRGLRLLVANRTPDRAVRLAQDWQGGVAALDPGPAAAGVSGVIVALSGPWVLAPETIATIAARVPWVIDLSAPPAVPADLAAHLGPRLLSIDDLTHATEDVPARLHPRLEALVEGTLSDLSAWLAAAADRDAARGLHALSTEARSAELGRLWRELQTLGVVEREAVERMTERLATRLLRTPLERLGQDHDGQYERAARELFRL